MTTNSATQVVNDIRDIKPPEVIPDGLAWLWWTLAAIAVVVLGIVLWRLLQKRSARIAAPPVIPAHIRARQKLADALAYLSEPKTFCTLVSDTARFYLEERFQFHAPERTTEEFLRELGGTKLLLPEQKESLGEFLASCDLVKFAKYEPGENELRALHSSALRLVDETEPTIDEPAVDQQHAGTPPQVVVGPVKTPASGVRGSSGAKQFAIFGILLQLAPTVWVISYFASIYRLYKLAVNSPSAASNHGLSVINEIMSQEQAIMKNELWLIVMAILLGLIGLILLLISLIRLHYRAEWFFWFLIIYGFVLLWFFPFGTIFGIFFMVYCLTKRHEFLNPS